MILPNYYFNWECKYCRTRQKVYNGDPEDCTIPDVEVVKCCECGRLELAMDEWDFCSVHGLLTDDAEAVPVTEEMLAEMGFQREGERV